MHEPIDVARPLVVLVDVIDLNAIGGATTAPLTWGPGGPPLSYRLIAGPLNLEQTFKLSDEQVFAF